MSGRFPSLPIDRIIISSKLLDLRISKAAGRQQTDSSVKYCRALAQCRRTFCSVTDTDRLPSSHGQYQHTVVVRNCPDLTRRSLCNRQRLENDDRKLRKVRLYAVMFCSEGVCLFNGRVFLLFAFTVYTAAYVLQQTKHIYLHLT